MNSVQPIPLPGAPPPTIPEELHHAGAEDEIPFDVVEDRRVRRRALYARLLGVLGILLTLGFAAVTVGRAWLRSLPSVVWPAALERPASPDLPGPLAPKDEPVLPAPSVEPPEIPPVEQAPSAPVATSEGVRAEPSPEPPRTARPSGQREPRLPRSRTPAGEALLPVEPGLPPEPTPRERMTPEDLPAAPTVDPASPEAPPAGEAPTGEQPKIPADEGNTIFDGD